MKKILSILILFMTFQLNAQVLSYEQFGLLLSSESNQQGSARSMAMKNSFGALGGDLSAMSINPAGAAVFTNNMMSISLGVGNNDTQTTFYDNNTSNPDTNFSLSQVGGVMIFENDNYQSDWKKFVVGMNIYTNNNHNNTWSASGISNATWEDDLEAAVYTPRYTTVESQEYTTSRYGTQTALNFSFATQYKNFLYLGASINSFDVDYREESELREIANDGAGNTVDAYQKYWLDEKGGGVSFGIGVIVKPVQNIRAGISYTSPVWYDIDEESNVFYEDDDDYTKGYYNTIYSDGDITYENNANKLLAYSYELKTPSKLTGSFAYVFGEKGLISFDVTKKDFSKIRVKPNSEFFDSNDFIKANYKATYTYNLGAEWKIKKISIRGGYNYEETPYVYNIDTDNISGYAFGAGYNFGRLSLDFAYDYQENTDYYDFYPSYDDINGAELSKTNSKFVTTLAYVF